MARGARQIPGQMTLEMCVDRNNYVVQANDLVGGKQALSLNSAKLVRAAIMQIRKEDTELRPYLITIGQLSELLGISKANLYRDIDEMTNDILTNFVFIKKIEGRKESWVKFPWVAFCQYESDVGVTIQLNDRLKPFLIALKEHYTQYTLENILAMKSVYAIRIFEMLQSKIMSRTLPREGTYILMSVQEIKDGCDIGEKYKTFSNFRSRVLDIAVKEINRVTLYSVSYEYEKTGRQVSGINFFINMKYH